ncbi:hypothetical protein [Candidatus Thiodictyon syntrophicum]|jgi:hypothetical protein|uniref:Uncharacterized protein n=1 Tax=Candidatus Thiodictyon syntrophicum TaxID=1166950 RepID=A0A2K8U3Z6_9GAMM|nr:hypothetical protein [Candidatus Thiodictyon syntrophicum]AUB80316.1 hypothetical protein THSYN_04670 [Candidatus Thiodictyon syntrophicum]
MTITLPDKLSPTRFPNMSLQLAAILGFVLERQFTTPALAELVVTPDGHVLARPKGEPGPLAHIAAEADLRANLRRLGMAAGLDDAEWSEYAGLVSQRLGIDLQGGREGGTGSV